MLKYSFLCRGIKEPYCHRFTAARVIPVLVKKHTDAETGHFQSLHSGLLSWWGMSIETRGDKPQAEFCFQRYDRSCLAGGGSVLAFRLGSSLERAPRAAFLPQPCKAAWGQDRPPQRPSTCSARPTSVLPCYLWKIISLISHQYAY